VAPAERSILPWILTIFSSYSAYIRPLGMEATGCVSCEFGIPRRLASAEAVPYARRTVTGEPPYSVPPYGS
jgi:hypothetical protein